MAGKRIDVVAAGHICLDITPQFGDGGGRSVERIFVPGSLLNMGPVMVSSGGLVPNAGFALRRLGINVALMGKRADDSFGDMLSDLIRREAPGSERSMISVRGEQTSYTVVLAPPGIDRIFLHCPGTNDTFTSKDINMAVVRKARLFHFGYPPLMRSMYEDGGRELTAEARPGGGR